MYDGRVRPFVVFIGTRWWKPKQRQSLKTEKTVFDAEVRCYIVVGY